jgi:PHD/YefM family antitoxin component YafN of YafNO toxin-antitoxin module
MKLIDLRQEQPTLDDLLRMATGDQVRIRSRGGKDFILESADAFDQEVAELSRSERFMAMLTERAMEPARTRLDELERRLAETEQAMKDRA